MKREHYKNFILKTLLDTGGSMERQDVIRKFEDKFLYGDGRIYLRTEELGDRGSDTHWGNELSWARNELKDEGLLKNNSPNGLWELSRKGERAVQELPPEDCLLYREHILRGIGKALSGITDPGLRQKVIKAMFPPGERGVA
jgi:hypothetical protein